MKKYDIIKSMFPGLSEVVDTQDSREEAEALAKQWDRQSDNYTFYKVEEKEVTIEIKYTASLKMFLFARWIATNYEGILNEQDGQWWKDQLTHFNKVVFDNYIKNGSAKDALTFLNDNNKPRVEYAPFSHDDVFNL